MSTRDRLKEIQLSDSDDEGNPPVTSPKKSAPPPPTQKPVAKQTAAPSPPTQKPAANQADQSTPKVPPKQPEQQTAPSPPTQKPAANQADQSTPKVPQQTAPSPPTQKPAANQADQSTPKVPPKQPEQQTAPSPPTQKPAANQADQSTPKVPPKQPEQQTAPSQSQPIIRDDSIENTTHPARIPSSQKYEEPKHHMKTSDVRNTAIQCHIDPQEPWKIERGTSPIREELLQGSPSPHPAVRQASSNPTVSRERSIQLDDVRRILRQPPLQRQSLYQHPPARVQQPGKVAAALAGHSTSIPTKAFQRTATAAPVERAKYSVTKRSASASHQQEWADKRRELEVRDKAARVERLKLLIEKHTKVQGSRVKALPFLRMTPATYSRQQLQESKHISPVRKPHQRTLPFPESQRGTQKQVNTAQVRLTKDIESVRQRNQAREWQVRQNERLITQRDDEWRKILMPHGSSASTCGTVDQMIRETALEEYATGPVNLNVLSLMRALRAQGGP